MKIRTLLTLLVLAAAAGCEGQRTIPGPTQPPSGGNVPAATIAVLVEGRVIDADRDGPVPGAVVTTGQAWRNGQWVLPAVSATADDQGRFSFTANLPPGWQELILAVSRDGFEPNGVIYVYPADVTAVELRLLPTLTIRPGESIETHVFLGSGITCFIESALCRRVVVESPSGESTDLEVIAADDTQKVGLTGPLATQPYSVDEIGRRVTVSSGEVWIIPLSAEPTGVRSVFDQRVTLTAHRR